MQNKGEFIITARAQPLPNNASQNGFIQLSLTSPNIANGGTMQMEIPVTITP
ncbi:MAG: hypothetical protein M1491_08270 [Deltaproteobacteria bacterium]|nr:hypothetical protein [Deltaproteobacteria bacterium]MCL5276668.1 hypothetical protein [Deltaproteobacteria bacterium]